MGVTRAGKEMEIDEERESPTGGGGAKGQTTSSLLSLWRTNIDRSRPYSYVLIPDHSSHTKYMETGPNPSDQ